MTREEIFALPKSELHVHLDGSLRLSTILELAEEQGKLAMLPAQTEAELWEILKQVDDSPTLEAYLTWFSYTIPLLQSHDSIKRVAFELAEDNALENVKYLEVRYAPILSTDEGLSMEQVMDAIFEGFKEAEAKYDIICRFIVCGLRDRFESASLQQSEIAVAYKNKGVVAFDLAGGEAGRPPKHHLSAFYHAINNLMCITIHAGEAWGPDSIQQALTHCRAHRIGHGTSLYKDPKLMEFFRDHQIPLEVCPTSNVQTHVVDGFAEHPLKIYADARIPVTINTDNRLFSRTTVTEELWRVHTLCGITDFQLRHMIYSGFRHAFLPWDEKQTLIKRVKPIIFASGEE